MLICNIDQFGYFSFFIPFFFFFFSFEQMCRYCMCKVEQTLVSDFNQLIQMVSKQYEKMKAILNGIVIIFHCATLKMEMVLCRPFSFFFFI